MDLHALRDANLSRLGDAVTDWQQMAKKLKELQGDAEKDLGKKAKTASWAGINSAVTREFVKKTAEEFADAHTQANTIAKILSDTKDELATYHGQLIDAIERAAKKNIEVTDTGDGTFRVADRVAPPVNAGKGDGDVRSSHPQDLEDIRDEVRRILSKATETDRSAKEVLKALVDAVKYGFSDARYPDRDHAAQALKDAEKAAALARDPESMSLDDIRTFNAYLQKHHDDPLFAERFATRLGAKETLQFWADMTGSHRGVKGEELGQLKELQKNLSMTLATASVSDSGEMQKWKSDLLRQTNTSFRTSTPDPVSSGRAVGALGYQVISSLMTAGKYDTEFLDAYREKLLKQDMATGSGGVGTKDFWEKGYSDVDLVFGEGDGRDPLKGILGALSRNPEAAIHAFAEKQDLNHLLETSMYTDRGTSLGHALEAAVTGIAYGDPDHEALPHSKTQVEIMGNVMHAIARPNGGGDLVTKGIGESFGHMAAAYMPEISREFGGPGSGAVFLTQSDDPSALERTDVTRFLTQVARDPDGRAGIRYGESIYTGSLLDAHLANPSLFDGSTEQVITDISQNAGIIEGIVGRSVADADIGEAKEVEEEENDATERQGEYFKGLLAAGVGVAVVALVPGGELAGAAAGGLFSGVASMAADNLVDGRKLDDVEDEALYRSGQQLNRTQDSVNQQTQWSVEEALKRHHVDLPKDGTGDLVRRAVNYGWGQSDIYMTDAERRPN